MKRLKFILVAVIALFMCIILYYSLNRHKQLSSVQACTSLQNNYDSIVNQKDTTSKHYADTIRVKKNNLARARKYTARRSADSLQAVMQTVITIDSNQFSADTSVLNVLYTNTLENQILKVQLDSAKKNGDEMNNLLYIRSRQYVLASTYADSLKKQVIFNKKCTRTLACTSAILLVLTLILIVK